MNLDGMVQILGTHVTVNTFCGCYFFVLSVEENEPLLQERRPTRDLLCEIPWVPSWQSYPQQQSSRCMGQQASHPSSHPVITMSSQVATHLFTQPVTNTLTHPVIHTSTQLHSSTQPVTSTSSPTNNSSAYVIAACNKYMNRAACDTSVNSILRAPLLANLASSLCQSSELHLDPFWFASVVGVKRL